MFLDFTKGHWLSCSGIASADIDGDFLREIAIGDSDRHFGNVANLARQVVGPLRESYPIFWAKPFRQRTGMVRSVVSGAPPRSEISWRRLIRSLVHTFCGRPN